MKLAELLLEKRDSIVAAWIDKIMASYPADTARHLRDQKDQILNPVGHTIRTETAALFDALVNGASDEDLSGSMDNLVKIRAVQDYPPHQALAFVFVLKGVVRSALGERSRQNGLRAELQDFDSRVDGLALLLFDRYMMCKERVYEIRVMEARMRSAKLIEQVNKLYGEDKVPDDLKP